MKCLVCKSQADNLLCSSECAEVYNMRPRNSAVEAREYYEKYRDALMKNFKENEEEINNISLLLKIAE